MEQKHQHSIDDSNCIGIEKYGEDKIHSHFLYCAPCLIIAVFDDVLIPNDARSPDMPPPPPPPPLQLSVMLLHCCWPKLQYHNDIIDRVLNRRLNLPYNATQSADTVLTTKLDMISKLQVSLVAIITGPCHLQWPTKPREISRYFEG